MNSFFIDLDLFNLGKGRQGDGRIIDFGSPFLFDGPNKGAFPVLIDSGLPFDALVKKAGFASPGGPGEDDSVLKLISQPSVEFPEFGRQVLNPLIDELAPLGLHYFY